MREFDYGLPEGAIAQSPAEPRDSAKLLVDCGIGQPVQHLTVANLPGLIAEGDVVVVNELVGREFRVALSKGLRALPQVLLQRLLEFFHGDQVGGRNEAVDLDEENESRRLIQAIDPVKGYETDYIHC